MLTMSTEELQSFLAGHEERRLYAAVQNTPSVVSSLAPLSGILGPPPGEVNYANSHNNQGRCGNGSGKGNGKGGKGKGKGNLIRFSGRVDTRAKLAISECSLGLLGLPNFGLHSLPILLAAQLYSATRFLGRLSTLGPKPQFFVNYAIVPVTPRISVNSVTFLGLRLLSGTP
ncbi:hypothetical protein CRG98_014139 [Punica granatum]|uniref:Uncharacterized protein n=1 Tax=Punica granatum TaxID=22663 RepID=A0A2I0KAB3_PUNGR|nr:hypothetical protein CRG98_014139 [Punica granatum]